MKYWTKNTKRLVSVKTARFPSSSA
ncbi:hypothetical protein EI547_13230 [Halomonas sp. FME20]|uniref:Uncharacterized protein n=1 Tax=Halomonas colorata TaxID=2742615 RepID=A0ABR9G0I7_9GAMM|nr:hypothetical protein [Halomonas colorata]